MSSSYKVSPDIRYRVIDDEAVVVRQREGDVLVLNQVAARVLQLVDENLSGRDRRPGGCRVRGPRSEHPQ